MAAVEEGIKQVALSVSTETTSSDSSDNGANVVCKIKPLTPPSSGSPPRNRSPRSPRSPRDYKKGLIDENANKARMSGSSDESGAEDTTGTEARTDSDKKANNRSPKLSKTDEHDPGAEERQETTSDSEDGDGGDLVIAEDRLTAGDDEKESSEEDEDSGTQKEEAEVKPSTPRVPATTVEDTEDVPPGWHRRISQRMTGKSAGKYDVYIISPEGRRFRSRPELMVHLEKNNLDYTIDDFSFKYKGSPSGKTVVKTPKPAPSKRRKTPMKRPLLEKTGQAKAKRKKASPKKRTTPTGRGPRKVLQPPDSKKDKASRSQAFQKLLVRMNFKKPGERLATSSSESECDDDDFDDGLV